MERAFLPKINPVWSQHLEGTMHPLWSDLHWKVGENSHVTPRILLLGVALSTRPEMVPLNSQFR